jgi:hypothetical protein
VYLVTYAIIGDGDPLTIIRNIQDFAAVSSATDVYQLWFNSSWAPLVSVLSQTHVPIMGLLGSSMVENLLFYVPFAIHLAQAMILLAFVAAWLRPEVVPGYRLTNLGTCLALITSEAGGYTHILVLFLTFMEASRGIGRRVALVAAYVICVPIDVVIFYLPPVIKEGFFAGGPMMVEYPVTYGPLIRPGILLIVPIALACVTIKDVWTDVRARGWMDRRRFKGDFPLLADGGGVQEPDRT